MKSKAVDNMLGILKKYLFLSLVEIIILDVICAAGMFIIYHYDFSDSWIGYTVYSFSFYGVVVSSIFVYSNIVSVRNKVKKVYLIQKYQNDIQFKMKIRLFCSSCINLLYAGFKLFIGYRYTSIWEINIGIYYLLLFIICFVLLRQVNYAEVGKNKKEEYRKSIRCGYFLIILNVILSAVVIMMIKDNYTYNYPGYMIYVVAMYVFYNIITGTINLIKYHKYHSPVINSANTICFISALVSLLTLQTAMLTQFGDENIQMKQFTNGLTGAVVCLTIFIISIYMVVHSKKHLKIHS